MQPPVEARGFSRHGGQSPVMQYWERLRPVIGPPKWDFRTMLSGRERIAGWRAAVPRALRRRRAAAADRHRGGRPQAVDRAHALPRDGVLPEGAVRKPN